MCYGKYLLLMCLVALFTRAWIEISVGFPIACCIAVALFTRAWIEMVHLLTTKSLKKVALFTRAWIEITAEKNKLDKTGCRPLHEGVD